MDDASSEGQTYLYSDLVYSDHPSSPPAVKRAFCERCKKAQRMCICGRFKGGLVRNRTKVTILQSSDERNHPIGSARIALLGLDNVGLVEVPEIRYSGTFRIRPKVPGSKRCLAGRGGKKRKGPLPLLAHGKAPSDSQLFQLFQLLLSIFDDRLGLLTFDAFRRFMCCSVHAEDKQSAGVCQDRDRCMDDMRPDVATDDKHRNDDGIMNAHDDGCMYDARQDIDTDEIHQNDGRGIDAACGECCMDDVDQGCDMHSRDNCNKIHLSCSGVPITRMVCDGMPIEEECGNTIGNDLNAYSNGLHVKGDATAMHCNDKDGLHMHSSNFSNPSNGDGIHRSLNHDTHLCDRNGANAIDGDGLNLRMNNEMHMRDGNAICLCDCDGLAHPSYSNGVINECATPGDSISSEVSDDAMIEALVPPGVALLFPSDKAIELSSNVCARADIKNRMEPPPPSHLIVLDGTWPKARRIYFDNPWLQRIPHYKLSPSTVSLYAGVRKEPKPECLSTIESIVFALKALEPETQGLDGLLEVFDSMVEDQRQCKERRSSTPC